MKQNSSRCRPRRAWNTLALLAALNLVPCSPGLAAVPPRAAQDKPPDKNQLEFNYQGKVESVDASAKAFKVDGKVFSVTRDTKIMKDGKPIQLDEVTAGNSASGLARQGFNGKFEAVTVTVAERKP